MTTAPDTIKANFMWDYDRDGEPVAVPVVGCNTGHLEEIITQGCGCTVAVYTLDDCGGPADLLIGRCDGAWEYGCQGRRYEQVDGARFRITAA